ncbi:MAG TPA: SPFH domain-containing protein [Thermoplasmata archaeon]|nr:SPFH domain-containing protein [Thermoplasmata archaeon]
MLADLLFWGEVGAAAAAAAGSVGFTLHALYVPVPPHKALVLYGRRSRRTAGVGGDSGRDVETRSPRILVGGGAFVAPWNKAFGYLSLAPIEVDPTVRALHTVQGGAAAGWEVDLAVEAKVPAEPSALRAAAENLLGMSPEEVRAFVRRSVESVVPGVLAHLRVGDAEPDWERLGTEIQAAVAPELVGSGIVVRSVMVRELRRIAQPIVGVASAEPRRRPPMPSGAASPHAAETDLRLARIDRGLRAMSAQVERWMIEAGRPGAFEPSDPTARPEATALPADGVSAVPYDSMVDGRPARLPRAPVGVRTDDAGEPPTLSDDELRR